METLFSVDFDREHEIEIEAFTDDLHDITADAVLYLRSIGVQGDLYLLTHSEKKRDNFTFHAWSLRLER